jgi:hypothetical protein
LGVIKIIAPNIFFTKFKYTNNVKKHILFFTLLFFIIKNVVMQAQNINNNNYNHRKSINVGSWRILGTLHAKHTALEVPGRMIIIEN